MEGITRVYVLFMKYEQARLESYDNFCSGGGGCGGGVRGDGRSHPRAALRLPLHVAQHNLLRVHMGRALVILIID